MKKMKIIDLIKNRYQWILKLLFAMLIIMVIWLIPSNAQNITVQLYTNLNDGENITVELIAKEAYDEQYVINDVIVTEGKISFRLFADYYMLDEMKLITDKDIQVSQIRMVTGKFVDEEIVICSYQASDIIQVDNKGISLSGETIEAIRNATENNWFVKLVLTVMVMLCSFIVWEYSFLKKKVEKFQSIFSCIISIVTFGAMGITLLEHKTTRNFHDISSVYYAVALIFVFGVVLTCCTLFIKESKFANALIIAIYVGMFIFSVGKSMFYSEYVGRTPDEQAHIAYVAYLEEYDVLIPRYEEMTLSHVISNDNKNMLIVEDKETINYLGHPPLYYHIMRLSNAIEKNEDGTMSVNLYKMRIFSMGIGAVAILLMFYIGYTRLKKIPYIHFLYAMICTSVPMMMYGISGVSNDTLALLTVTVFVMGIIRFSEKKRDIKTFLLIAIGITTTLFAKVTAGLVVVIAAMMVIMYYLIKEKCFKEVFNKKFYVTIPIYLVAIIYFVYIYMHYNTFQPSIFTIDPEYARTTGMYVAYQNRQSIGFFEYMNFFTRGFMDSWTGIASHVTLSKSQITITWYSIETMGLVSIWFIPIVLCIKKIREKDSSFLVLFFSYISTIITVLIQYRTACNAYINVGYLGGRQSRYYLCTIVVFGLVISKIVQCFMVKKEKNNEEKTNEKKGVYIRNIAVVATAILISLLAYEDFIYFIIYFKNYLTL